MANGPVPPPWPGPALRGAASTAKPHPTSCTLRFHQLFPFLDPCQRGMRLAQCEVVHEQRNQICSIICHWLGGFMSYVISWSLLSHLPFASLCNATSCKRSGFVSYASVICCRKIMFMHSAFRPHQSFSRFVNFVSAIPISNANSMLRK